MRNEHASKPRSLHLLWSKDMLGLEGPPAVDVWLPTEKKCREVAPNRVAGKQQQTLSSSKIVQIMLVKLSDSDKVGEVGLRLSGQMWYRSAKW